LRDIDKGVTFALAFERGMRREKSGEIKSEKKVQKSCEDKETELTLHSQAEATWGIGKEEAKGL
jgi:hypothetical protein